MVLSQIVILTQIVTNIWRALQEMLASVSLVAPQTCPVNWLAQLIEWTQLVTVKQVAPVKSYNPRQVKLFQPEQHVTLMGLRTPAKAEKLK